ncbi:MAG: MarC family NAAT transporter [Cyanobacteria bacterium]|nr:MarC family NAAT transporter [Cyanobacteriota bacterium]
MAAPVFVSLTQHETPEEQSRVAARAAGYVFWILVAFTASGSLILNFFGISIHALRIAGGMMILSSAYGMLNKRDRLLPEEQAEAAEKEDISFSPLAMPILSGPGAIAVMIGLTTDCDTWMHYAVVGLVIVLVCLACYFTLKLSNGLMEKLGKTMIKAFSRIMGFILLCVGVQFIVNGVNPLIKQLLKEVLKIYH